MSARDGGPAFPVDDLVAAGRRTVDVNPTTGAPAGAGISVRDYFAARAMAIGIDWTQIHETGGYEEAARIAYEVADAMIAAREVQP